MPGKRPARRASPRLGAASLENPTLRPAGP
jgi:hypothetical protein